MLVDLGVVVVERGGGMEGTSTWLFKENKGGYIPCGSLACKGFYKVERNLKNRWLLGDWM